MISVTCENVNEEINITTISNGGEKTMPYTIDYDNLGMIKLCLLYTSPSPRDRTRSRMPSSA